MAMWAMVVAMVTGMGFWRPVQLIAAAWLGPQAMMNASVSVILVGLMTHMMVGALLGTMGLVILRMVRIPVGPVRLVWGMLFGLVVWIINQFVILPVVDPMLATHMTPWAFAVGHLMFGVVLAAFLRGRRPRTA